MDDVSEAIDIGVDFQDKVGRLRRVVASRGLAGLLIASQANFAWLSGGRSNGIDLSREAGAGALLLGADGRSRALADAIEMPRLVDEALAGLAVEPIEYPWADAAADPAFVSRLAAGVLGDARPIGTDVPAPGLVDASLPIRRARALLTASEAIRYRRLGLDVGTAMGEVCASLRPGVTELEVTRLVTAAIAGVGARCPVLLVGADDRIARYRHPVPTATPWTRRVMVVVCAERDGLVVALTRVVDAGGPDPAHAERTAACARVFAAMAGATIVEANGADVFAAATRAYAQAGFAGEEHRHHQGGAIGYASRDWIAHPHSDERVHARQAFAWNPSITGAKIEDTLLVDGNHLDVITATPDWPTIALQVGGRTLEVAGVRRI